MDGHCVLLRQAGFAKAINFWWPGHQLASVGRVGLRFFDRNYRWRAARKDGNRRDGLLQLFDDVSAAVVLRRFETGLAEAGWMADEPDKMTFTHPNAGVRITLAVDEPGQDIVMVLITAEAL